LNQMPNVGFNTWVLRQELHIFGMFVVSNQQNSPCNYLWPEAHISTQTKAIEGTGAMQAELSGTKVVTVWAGWARSYQIHINTPPHARKPNSAVAWLFQRHNT